MTLIKSVFELLKYKYRDGKVENMVYGASPVLGLFKKVEVPGKSFQVGMKYSSTNNRSATFADSQSGTDYGKTLQWFITASKNYNVARVDLETILSAKNNTMGFADAVEFEVSSAIEALNRDIAHTMYKDGSGTVGVISAINTGTNVITFTSIAACRELEVGSRIEGSANADLSSPNANTLTVVAIDREAGTVTYTGTDTSWTTGYYVFQKGDANAKFKGLAAWLPSGAGRAAALAASFFGVVRSADASRLGGLTFDCTGKTIFDSLIEAETRLRTIGGDAPDLIIMSAADEAALKQEVAGKYTIGNAPGNGCAISYESITLHSMRGSVKIVVDDSLDQGTAYMLKKDTWEIGYLGDSIVNTWEQDGLKSLRMDSQDGLEIRFFSFIQPYCRAPGKNLVMTNLQS